MSNATHRTVLILTADRQIDRRILQQADTLETAGWKVTILAMPLDKFIGKEDPRVVRIEMKLATIGVKNFSLLSSYRTIRQYFPMNGRLMQFMKRLAWKYFANQESFYMNVFSSYVSHYSPQVVMAIDLPMLPLATETARRCNAKLIYDSHELYSEQEFSTREKQRWENIEAKYITACDSIITVNPSIASELARRYNLSHVNVIYNTVPSNDLPSKSQLFHRIFSLSPAKKILLFQGGLSKGRNLETLIAAMRYVKNPNINLVILGDGKLRDALERKAKSDKCRVYFHPAVPQEQLQDYTQAADVGIIPYQATCLNNYYCTPNKLFEFLAAGLPLLSSDLPEINNIINNHGIGLTGKMSTAKEISALIDDFFSDEERLTTWQKNVLLARKQFSWAQEEKRLLHIFQTLTVYP